MQLQESDSALLESLMRWDAPREPWFEQFTTAILEPFWQQTAKPETFSNREGLTIHCVSLLNDKTKQGVVISPGRVEGYLKYKEIAFDLYQQGYSVFIIDHQGQGLSSRRLSNPHKGYVASFEDYVDDLNQFIEQIVLPAHSGELMLLAHSMGCAIGLRHLQRFPGCFSGAIFSSPMWGFLSGGVPRSVAKSVVSGSLWLSETIAGESGYFFGNTDYRNKPFDGNELTSSSARYRYFRQVYEQEPKLQLGGITFAWIVRAVEALELAFNELDKVNVPVLVLQAGQEMIIDNRAQNMFCQELTRITGTLHAPLVFSKGKHELFIESDDIRKQVLAEIFQFVEQLQNDAESTVPAIQK